MPEGVGPSNGGIPLLDNNDSQAGPSGNQDLDQWNDAINKAAEKTGLDPNLIKAMIYAESSGDPSTSTINPGDGAPDVGLMQISQSTYESLSGAPAGLDINNPTDNIMAGAFELKSKIDAAGGDLQTALELYRGHDDDPSEGIWDGGDEPYAQTIIGNVQNLIDGRPLNVFQEP